MNRFKQGHGRRGGVPAVLLGLLAVVSVRCGSDGNFEQSTAALTVAASAAATSPTTLNTFINQSLEIDQLGPAPPPDANLYLGLDPADGTPSRAFPTGGPGTFIDWHDLGGDLSNHRFLDLDNPATGRDDTAFPRSNECVAAANVLKKMDLTYVAAANNLQYTYLGVQRSANNGDAGYYWVFTRSAPRLVQGEAPCSASERRLVYDVTGPGAGGTGDILISGHFHPSGEPLVRVFTAVANRANVGAVSAINYSDTTLWREDTSGVAAAAVNTTRTAPGSFGSAGVVSLTGGNLGVELFAEAAVPLSVFTGGSPCGATYFGMVITRSSGSGGTSPDLKDMAGPAVFNFGRTEARPTLNPTCGASFTYQGGATRPDGTVITDPTCAWSFSNGTTSSSCDGSLTGLAPGSYTGSLTITDPATNCTASTASTGVSVYAPLAVSASLSQTCAASFGYSATVSGGSGAVSYAWAFSGGGAVTPATSSAASGTVAVGTAGVSYTGNVTVTDARTDIACSATASASVTPSPFTVTARLTPTCGLSFGYESTITGPDGAPLAGVTCAWTFSNGASSTSCAGSLPVSAAGSYTGTLTVRSADTSCVRTVTTAALPVYEPLAAAAVLAGTCASTFTYNVVVTGGSNPSGGSYAWSFSGGGAVSPATSTAAAGVVTVGTPGVPYTGTVTVTDPRPDIACTVTASGSAVPHRIRAAAALAPTCRQAFTYSAAGTASDGSPLGSPTCAWSFSSGATAMGCGGELAGIAPGSHTGTVTVTDPVTGCSDTVPAGPVQVYTPLSAAAIVAPACSAITYDVAVSGGSDPSAARYAWSFTGPGSVSPAASSTRSGSVAVGTAGEPYTASVVVTDGRTDIVCTASSSGSASAHRTTAIARLTPTCGLSFGYQASGTNAVGGAVAGATCAWTFDTGASSTTCDGSAPAAAGAHTGTVVVTDPATGCSATLTTVPVNVYAPLTVAADLTATCSGSFTYGAVVSGGSNPSGTPVAWTFTGGGTVSPATSGTLAGSVSVGTPAVSYTGTVVATDPRGDIACSATATDSATPYVPLTVRLTPAAAPPSCPGMTSDAVTYNATVSGGDGAYTYTWSGASCAGTACTLAPPAGTFCHAQTIHVSVSDGSGLCPAALSEDETYQKITVINASDN